MKISSLKYLLFLCLSTCISLHTYAQNTLTEQSEISLLTCSPGTEIYSIFGHTSIRIYDPIQQLDIVYNYGTFDFDTPGFYTKFLRGKLLYQLTTGSYSRFLRAYDYEKRSVYEQTLDLSLDEKNKIFQALQNNRLKENRAYLYDFFMDNCSTRPKDIILNSLKGAQFPKDKSAKTRRNILDEHLGPYPWTDFGIDLIIGAVADTEINPHEECYIPSYLQDHFQNTFIQNKPLVKKETLVVNHLDKQQQIPFFTPTLLFSILLLLEIILLIFRQKMNFRYLRFYDLLWASILFICSIIILFMWFGTDHAATKSNWNLLWISPIYILYLLFYNKKSGNPKPVLLVFIALNLVSLLSFYFIPQQFHSSSILLILTMLVKFWRNLSFTSK